MTPEKNYSKFALSFGRINDLSEEFSASEKIYQKLGSLLLNIFWNLHAGEILFSCQTKILESFLFYRRGFEFYTVFRWSSVFKFLKRHLTLEKRLFRIKKSLVPTQTDSGQPKNRFFRLFKSIFKGNIPKKSLKFL